MFISNKDYLQLCIILHKKIFSNTSFDRNKENKSLLTFFSCFQDVSSCLKFFFMLRGIVFDKFSTNFLALSWCLVVLCLYIFFTVYIYIFFNQDINQSWINIIVIKFKLLGILHFEFAIYSTKKYYLSCSSQSLSYIRVINILFENLFNLNK